MFHTVLAVSTVTATTRCCTGSYSGVYAPDPRAKTCDARVDEGLHEWLFMKLAVLQGAVPVGCDISCKHACM